MRQSIRRLLCGLAMFLLVPGLVFAQEGAIEGVVTDGETNDPLPGATVQILGLEIGTASAADGSYELTGVPTGQQTMQVSFVGYQTVERRVQVRAGETINVNFALMPSAEELEEVVVTGVSVGTETQKLGFSVSKVSAEELQAVPGTDPANALRAKTPGARIVQPSGQPGSSPSIRLRGTTTLSGSQEPLVVVDGAITGGSLEDIDMQAVESIEIIKGAAAASLYGSLAGNGVIQIITKRGSDQVGTTRVTVRNEFGFTQLANKIDLADHHNRAGRDESGNPITGSDVGGGEFRQACDTPPCPVNPQAPDNVFDNTFSQNFDQQETLYDPKAFFTNFVSVASRQESMNYLLSFENLHNDGIVSGVDPYQRRNIRLNVDNQVSNRVEVSASVLYSDSEGFDAQEQGQGANNLFYGALLAFPDLDLDAPAPDSIDAEFNPFSTAGNAANPLYRASAIDRSFGGRRLLGNFQADIELADWLTVDGQFSWDRDDENFRLLTPKGTFPSDPASPRSSGNLFESESTERVAIAQGRALFSYEFGDLATNFTAKYSYEDRQIDSFNLSGSDFRAREVPQFPNTDPGNLSPGQFEATIRSEDIVGNLQLDYLDRYIIDAVLRRERVSLFGPDARNATYYRVAGTYRVSEDFEIPRVAELKLRGSYGISGSRPPFVAQYETFTVTSSGITKQRLGNRNIQPADVAEFEVGLDANFLDRFYFEGTYSQSNADDQVLEVPLSSAAGFNTQFQNAGDLETTTWEFATGGQLIAQSDWGVDVGIVFDRTRQTVTRLDRPSFNQSVGAAIPLFRVEEGVDLGVMYGNKLATSIDQLNFTDDGCLVGVTGANSDCLQQGDLTINSDGYVIEEGTQYTANENPFYIRDETGAKVTTQIGDSNPEFNMGFNATLRYKNFSLFTTLDWEQGADVYNYTRQLLYFNDRHGDLDQSDKPEDQRRPGSYYTGPLYNQASASSHFVEDASFLKVREISLSYRFTNDFLQRIGLGGTIYDAQFSLLGRNLFTFTGYNGYDPEVSTETADQPANYKIDDFAYPNFRTFAASLEIRL